MKSRAIVTVCSGEFYKKVAAISHPTIKAYAGKVKSDFIVLNKTPKGTPHYEKFQIGELLESYSKVLYLDTDILIREDAPDLFDKYSGSSFVAFNEGQFIPERLVLFRNFLREIEEDPFSWDGDYFNTGVMLLDKGLSEIFRRPRKEYNHFFEQSYINFLLHKHNVKTEQLHYKFNRMECMDKITNEERWDSYFLHYAGALPNMGEESMLESMQKDLTKWSESAPHYTFQKRANPNPISIDGNDVPTFRLEKAIRTNVEKNILMYSGGGVGDHVCAEPVMRYALKHFKGNKISLASHYPDFFKHLDFENVFNLKEDKIELDKYLMFSTLNSPNSFDWQFHNHFLMHPVDFMSVSAFKMQLPIADREINIPTSTPERDWVEEFIAVKDRAVAIHPGVSWSSKTFPKWWYDQIITGLLKQGLMPVIVGDKIDWRTTVNVDATGCLDLRGRSKFLESTWVLQNVRCLITNDSSPLHMAASGEAWIGFVTMCKQADYLYHWRKGQFGWRMKDFGKGGFWMLYDACPNKRDDILGDKLPEGLMEQWLPEPSEMVEWAREKVRG